MKYIAQKARDMMATTVSTWDIVGLEVSNAVLEFFHNGKLLKEINHTILTLLPKTETPQNATEYRPIACCTVL